MYYLTLKENESHNGNPFDVGAINAGNDKYFQITNKDMALSGISMDKKYIALVDVDESKLFKGEIEGEFFVSEIEIQSIYDLDAYSTWDWIKAEGIDVNKWEDYAFTTMSGRGNMSVISWFVRDGVDVNVNDGYALQSLCENSALEDEHAINAIELLIDCHADLHLDDDAALVGACTNGNTAVVKYLIENGADIKADNNMPIRCAEAFGHTDIVDYIQSKELDVEINFIDISVAENGFQQIENSVIDEGADLEHSSIELQ